MKSKQVERMYSLLSQQSATRNGRQETSNPVDPVVGHYTSQERQPATEPELQNNKPHQPPKQSHAEDHTEHFEATNGDHCWRTGRLKSRQEHHRADLQSTNSLWEISPAPARPLPCLHRLQEGLWQGLACSFVGSHEPRKHSATRSEVDQNWPLELDQKQFARRQTESFCSQKLSWARGILSGPDPFFYNKNGSRSALIKLHWNSCEKQNRAASGKSDVVQLEKM